MERDYCRNLYLSGTTENPARPDRCVSAPYEACGPHHLASSIKRRVHRNMNVFIGNIENELAGFDFMFDGAQASGDLHRVGPRHQLHLRKHVGMRDGAANVMAKEPPIPTATMQ